MLHIPVLSDTLYIKRGFLELCLGQHEVAEEMFLSAGWEHPKTWLEEQFRKGELDICSNCRRIFRVMTKRTALTVVKEWAQGLRR